MKNFRHITSAILALSLALTLTACGGKKEEAPAESGSEAPAEATTEKYLIGINQYGQHASLDNCRIGFLQGLEEAGLKEGDVITAVDGKKVVKMSELQEYLTNKRPGDKVTITYLRKKAKKTATLTLKNEQGNTNIVKDADLDVLGGTFRPVTEQEKKDMNISYGLAVTKVANGALKDAAVYKGFIILQANDTPMKTLNDLQKAVKDASTSKDPVLILKGISPTGKKAYFAVMLDKQ